MRVAVERLTHEQLLCEHVDRSLQMLAELARRHDAEGQCTRTPQCRYCSLWAISNAQIRRVLDLLKKETRSNDARI